MMSPTENSGKDSPKRHGEDGGAPSRSEGPGSAVNVRNFREGSFGGVAGVYFIIELPRIEGFEEFTDFLDGDGRVHFAWIALYAYGIDLNPSSFIEGCKIVKPFKVLAVLAKSPAAHDSRLKAGDVLVKINGRVPVSTSFASQNRLKAENMHPMFGQNHVVLTVFRENGLRGDSGSDGNGGTQFSTWITRDPKFHDVIFEVENEEIPSNKSLITGRSPVFEAMLTHDMLEKKTGRIKITNFEARIFRAALNFIHTDRLEIMGNITDLMELALAGDFFDIKTLKEEVSQRLLYCINKETAVKILVLSKEYGLMEEEFAKFALQFIAMWSPEIFSKPSFADLKSDSELLFRLLEIMSGLSREEAFFVGQLFLRRADQVEFPWDKEDLNRSKTYRFDEFHSNSFSPPSLSLPPDFPDDY